MSIPFKGVIFDMDGTLIESTWADYLAWKNLFADYNKPLTFQRYFPLLGIKSAEVIQTYLQLTGEALQNALKRKLHYFKEIVLENGIKTVPFAEEFLKNIKNNYSLKLALATSSRKEKTAFLMEHTGLLSYFNAIVTGEEATRGKPEPDIFLKAAEKLNLPNNECIVIEDAVNGVLAAKNAGIKCIAITNTHPGNVLQKAKADIIIDSFKNIDFEELCSRLS